MSYPFCHQLRDPASSVMLYVDIKARALGGAINGASWPACSSRCLVDDLSALDHRFFIAAALCSASGKRVSRHRGVRSMSSFLSVTVVSREGGLLIPGARTPRPMAGMNGPFTPCDAEQIRVRRISPRPRRRRWLCGWVAHGWCRRERGQACTCRPHHREAIVHDECCPCRCVWVHCMAHQLSSHRGP